jgi:hypothetical protein
LKFLAAAGLLLSQGLEALVSYFSKKVTPSGNITVYLTTKILIEKSVNTSKRVL